jgi:hypothetical protein
MKIQWSNENGQKQTDKKQTNKAQQKTRHAPVRELYN